MGVDESAGRTAGPDDAGFWEAIYAEGPPPWDRGEAAPPLVRAIDLPGWLPPAARVIVPGCGFGHEAIALARRGHAVTAVDFAAPAVAGLRARAEAEGLHLDALRADFLELGGDLAGRFDALVEHTCFCAIPPTRRADYVDVAASLLRPGGVLVGLFFEVDGTMADGPPYPTTRLDVIEQFGAAFTVEVIERPADSFDGRQGREWLARLRRRTGLSGAGR